MREKKRQKKKIRFVLLARKKLRITSVFVTLTVLSTTINLVREKNICLFERKSFVIAKLCKKKKIVTRFDISRGKNLIPCEYVRNSSEEKNYKFA